MSQGVGCRRSGEVVVRGAQAAGYQDEVRMLQRPAQGSADQRRIVTDALHDREVVAQKEELSGRETARGVGDPAAGQFVADGDNFSCNVFVHGSSLLPGQCTRFRSSAQAPVSRIPNGPPASTRKSRTAAIFPTSASGPARRTGI